MRVFLRRLAPSSGAGDNLAAGVVISIELQINIVHVRIVEVFDRGLKAVYSENIYRCMSGSLSEIEFFKSKQIGSKLFAEGMAPNSYTNNLQ